MEVINLDQDPNNYFNENDYTERQRFLHSCLKCETNYFRRQFSVNEKFKTNANLNT